MTTDDIKFMQIMLVDNDGNGYLTKTDDSILIKMIVSMCKFVKLKGKLEEISIGELIK
jgi:hypothetical protein